MRLIILFLLTSTALASQHTLKGIVIDANNGESLPFVNVFLKNNQSRGILTNERGEYEIRLTSDDRNDQLVFSLLSYTTHTEPVHKILEQRYFNLQMETSFINLGEVVVISDTGLKNILKKVEAAIPKNYPNKPYLLKAYSRRYDIDNDSFSLYTEAVLNIREKKRNENWDRLDLDVRIAQYRGSIEKVESLRDKWEIMDWQIGLLANYHHNGNIARLGKLIPPYKGKKSFYDVMTFTNRGEYLAGKDTIIRIHYHLNSANTDIGYNDQKTISSFFTGEFLINKSDYAVLQLTIGERERTCFSEFTFRKHGDKYYPHHLSYRLGLTYKYDTRTYRQSEELYVLDVVTNPKEITAQYKGKPLFSQENFASIKVKYDIEFWAKNEMLLKLSAPEEMRFFIEKMHQNEARLKFQSTSTPRDSMKR